MGLNFKISDIIHEIEKRKESQFGIEKVASELSSQRFTKDKKILNNYLNLIYEKGNFKVKFQKRSSHWTRFFQSIYYHIIGYLNEIEYKNFLNAAKKNLKTGKLNEPDRIFVKYDPD